MKWLFGGVLWAQSVLAANQVAHGPDFVVDQAMMGQYIRFETRYFAPNDCAVVEGCVLKPGNRKLLRFYARITNEGDESFTLGSPSDPANQDHFVWSACHQHYHVKNWADYSIVSSSPGGPQNIIVGRKQAFCVEDTTQIHPLYYGQYSCDYQGITPGWADDYADNLPCQWLDVTEVPAGQYKLRVTVNPQGVYPETDFSNNAGEVTVQIP